VKHFSSYSGSTFTEKIFLRESGVLSRETAHGSSFAPQEDGTVIWTFLMEIEYSNTHYSDSIIIKIEE
jgi:hypothetical protein